MSTKEITKVTEKNIVVIEDESGPLEETNFSLPQTVDYLDMERQYRQLMYLHEAAIQQITAKLNILKGEFDYLR